MSEITMSVQRHDEKDEYEIKFQLLFNKYIEAEKKSSTLWDINNADERQTIMLNLIISKLKLYSHLSKNSWVYRN